MKRTGKLVVAAMALTTLVGTSAFAESRRQDGTWRDGSNGGQYDSNRRNDSNRGYRDNERVTVQGRISSFTRERDGYRINVDRGGQSYWVPSSHLRGHNLSVGISIRLGGVFRGGLVYVDDLGWLDGAYGYNDGSGYRDGYLRGVVDRVDYRRGILVLRDNATGRFVTVNMDRLDRRSRGADLSDLRRGDSVTLAGDWTRGGVFQAYRVESVRSGRW
jgi:hypothetical protein